MAESFLFSIAENVLGKIGSVTLQEICLAWRVEKDLKRLESTFTTIKALLLDAEDKQWKDQQLRVWLGKLKDVCYDVEDAFDEFEYHALQQQVLLTHGSLRRKVLHFFSSSNPIPLSFKVSHRIKDLRERLDDVAADRANFNLVITGTDRPPVVQREMTHSFVLPSEVIGRDEDKEKILNLLRNSGDGENTSVVPIVGIGGLGKTALAKLIYNDKWVIENFQKRMWVCVSTSFDLKSLIKSLITSSEKDVQKESGLSLTLAAKYDHLGIEELQTLLRSTLRDNKFFLVLDDVWLEDRREWIELKALLAVGAGGSKIMITTRVQSVAFSMGTTPPYNLGGLSQDDCLSIFLKWAFKEGEEKEYPGLTKIGNDIVKKCQGVPLAAKTLGSLLFSKFERRDWWYVRDNEIWNLQQRQNDILPALMVSFQQLPSHLKNCFAYCSLFPKGYEFDNFQLARFWMAQGLIQSSEENRPLEDIGTQYIKELLSRSFFQDLDDHGWYFEFKMHDLMHDLASLITKTECSCNNLNVSKTVRHVSFCDKELDENEIRRVLGELNNIRTIWHSIEEGVGPSNDSFVRTCFSKFKSIKVLDLSDSDFEELPSCIGNLKHLRFLALLNNRRIKKLPNSVSKLYNLQVLLLEGCDQLEGLPKDIGDLINLRDLKITAKQRSLSERVYGKGISCLESLRYLNICYCENLVCLPPELQRLTALRTLIIVDCRNLRRLPPSMKQLPALETLIIQDCERLNSMGGNGEDHTQGLKNLRFVVIYNLPNLVALPEWTHNLTSLETLHVEECPQLSALPHHMDRLTALERLEIWGCPQLIRRCKQRMGEDWHKIAHVPHIVLDGMTEIESAIAENSGSRRGGRNHLAQAYISDGSRKRLSVFSCA